MADTEDAILDEHHQCMKLASQVELLLRADHEGDWAQVLHERIGILREALAKHFHGEETGYLFVGLPEAYPRFGNRLDRLKAEHVPMLESLDEVREQAAALGSGGGNMDAKTLRKRVLAVISMLRRHEAEENEILYCAHWDDLGEGD